MTACTPPIKKGVIGTYKHMLIPTTKNNMVFSYLVRSLRESYNNHGNFLITEIMSSKHLPIEKLKRNLLESLRIMNILAY